MVPKIAENGTTLYAHNRIITARYNYSLIQERIFNYVLYFCQEYIKKVRAGMPVLQLDLFENMDHNNQINVVIPLKEISAPSDYPNVRDSLVKMREVTVSVRYKDKQGFTWRDYTGVIDSFAMPEGKERSNYVIAKMRKDVAEMLVGMERRADGTPINFTTFKYEICMSSKNKYTPRIYKLISSWKSKGGFYLSLEDLRSLLDLGTKYKDVEAIKRRILKPVQEELIENSDCWFNMSDADFEQKEGKRVVGFNFKVIDQFSKVNYVKQLEYIIYTFRTEYKFQDHHIEQIRPIIEDRNNWNSLDWRMQRINDKLKTDRSIHHVAQYVVTGILNHFKES